MFKIITITTLMLSVYGCDKTYRLKAEDLMWNPYKGGEVLVFQSNQGDKDTIFIMNIRKEKTVDDELASFPNYHESLDVIVKHSDPGPLNYQRYLESSFFEIFATRDKNTLINFDFAAKKAWFYADSYYRHDLEKLPIQRLANKNFTFNDVIKLEPQNKEYYERNEFITAIYWSRSKGYVRYDLKNGVYWELQ